MSDRLKYLVDLLPNSDFLVDIGSDHGLLCQMALEQGKVQRAIAIENKKGPYQRLSQAVAQSSHSDKIQCLFSQGATSLNQKGGVWVIAGMGGLLILDILRQSLAKAKTTQFLVLQPQSKIVDLRQGLIHLGFDIDRDEVMYEDKMAYHCLLVHPCDQPKPLTDQELAFGRNLSLLNNKQWVMDRYYFLKTVQAYKPHYQKELVWLSQYLVKINSREGLGIT